MAELVDASALKAEVLTDVRVRFPVPSPTPLPGSATLRHRDIAGLAGAAGGTSALAGAKARDAMSAAVLGIANTDEIEILTQPCVANGAAGAACGGSVVR